MKNIDLLMNLIYMAVIILSLITLVYYPAWADPVGWTLCGILVIVVGTKWTLQWKNRKSP